MQSKTTSLVWGNPYQKKTNDTTIRFYLLVRSPFMYKQSLVAIQIFLALATLGGCGHEIGLRPFDTSLSPKDSGPDDNVDIPPGDEGSLPGASARCEDLYEEPTGGQFFVDPANGSDSNDGSATSPWASIQYVVDNKVDCADQHGSPKHSSAPIKGGDSIVLVGEQGHGDSLYITGCFNDEYVHIVGEKHREPIIRYLKIRGGSYWHLEGISFESDGGGQMVKVEDHDTHGPGHNLRFHDNSFTSGDLQTKQEYIDHSTDAIRLTSTDDTAITCNSMRKIGAGVVASGDRIDFLYNDIRFFSRDALINGGSNNRYIGNTVYDSVKLGDGHHDDFFQSHMGSNPDSSSNIEIAYNVFINRYSAEQPADTRGPTQCIAGFEEGPKTGWLVYNNVCKADHWHGITLNDTHDSIVVNNTVVGGGNLPGGFWTGLATEFSWINVSGDGNVVRNNLTTDDEPGGDHNITVTAENVYDIFMDWEGLDLRLNPDAFAVNAGTSMDAPVDDIAGTNRDDYPDAGAYEHVQ